MSDATLTIEQSRQLIHELATNDAFRKRFAEKPAAALVELGIPYETVVNLKASCLSPRSIANKEVFLDAAKKLDDEAIQAYGSFIQPMVGFGTTK